MFISGGRNLDFSDGCFIIEDPPVAAAVASAAEDDADFAGLFADSDADDVADLDVSEGEEEGDEDELPEGFVPVASAVLLCDVCKQSSQDMCEKPEFNHPRNTLCLWIHMARQLLQAHSIAPNIVHSIK